MSTYYNEETQKYESFEKRVAEELGAIAGAIAESQGTGIAVVEGVRYDTDAQGLTDTQKGNARTNIGAIGAAELGAVEAEAVRHDEAQTLTDTQKAQARTNIGAASISAMRQSETHLIAIESGTFNDNNGAAKVANAKRLRNVSPIPVYDLYSITLPDGYSGWFFRLDKNGEHISAYSGWQSGTVAITTVATAATQFINIAIRKTAAPNDDISGDAATVEAGITTAYKSAVDLGAYKAGTESAINAVNRFENRIAFDAAGQFSNAKMIVNVSNGVVTIDDNEFGTSVYLELKKTVAQISGSSSASLGITLLANHTYRLRTIPISGSFEGADNRILCGITSGGASMDYTVTARGESKAFTYTVDTPASVVLYIAYGTSADCSFQYELADMTDPDAKPLVPACFSTQIQTVKANVQNDLMTIGRHGDSFVFITDTHWGGNYKHSPGLIRYLADSRMVNLIVNGGDLIDGSADKDYQLALQTECIDAFNAAGIPMITAVGNHDYNSGYGTSANYFTDEEYFATAQQHNALEGMVYGGDTYFYWDKVSTKTRYIVLDSGVNNIGNGTTIPTEQITWIQSVVGDTPEDYHIIVVVHDLGNYSSGSAPIDEENPFVLITGAQTLFDALDALLPDHMIEAVFFGHTHYDSVSTTTGGIPLISTNSDCKWQYYGMDTPADNTVDAQCFDVVTIDYKADGNGKKHIYLRRVGRGTDRTVEY